MVFAGIEIPLKDKPKRNKENKTPEREGEKESSEKGKKLPHTGVRVPLQARGAGGPEAQGTADPWQDAA